MMGPAMISETSKSEFRGVIFDRMVIVMGGLCAVPLIAGLAALAAGNALVALMVLMLAVPLVAIWLVLVLLMRVYRRRPSRWTMISAIAPGLLIAGGLVWLALVVTQAL